MRRSARIVYSTRQSASWCCSFAGIGGRHKMSNRYSGNYPIERRAGEIERLHIQSEAMAPDTNAMLDRFGDMRGWSCLDLGCGPGGITDLLSARVGAAGRVIGLDMDSEFLEH